jgi:ABC-2 type transport system ATP-binding protein
VLYTSHYMEEVERLCDRVGILDRGRLLKIGRVDQLDSASGEELQLQVLGEPAVIAAALEGLEYTLAGERGPWTLTIRPSDQREVDRCIDRLRAKEVSIIAMHRRRLSLEEVFLEVVQQFSHEPAS